MRRTAALAAIPALLVGLEWSRVEDGGALRREALAAAGLAVLASLAPSGRRRALAAAGAGLVVASQALAVPLAAAAPWDGEPFASRLARRLADGALAFWDVQLPLAAGDEPALGGVAVLAAFAFCLVMGLALAARRPLLAAAALVAGTAWPATLLGRGDTGLGALLLVLCLGLLALGRPAAAPPRPAVLAAAAALVALGVAGAGSPAAASGSLLGWRGWDPYDAPADPVSVSYVWDASYDGIRFPKRTTTVLTVEGVSRPLYWRATTLDVFDGVRWRERLRPVVTSSLGADLTSDPFLPPEARSPARWVTAVVTVKALRDRHLPGPATPVAYATRGLGSVDYAAGGAARAHDILPEGTRYVVRAWAPRPSPRQLARARPTSLLRTTLESPFLEVAPGLATLPWGSPGRDAELPALLRRSAPAGPLAPYARLARTARRVVGRPASPYAAVVALESWFRSDAFRYEEQPGPALSGPPLVDFATRTHAGYCQHFAGAMALMLRLLGIPSRVAVGFTSGSWDEGRRRWTVTDHDAHAWVEVWFDGWGWLPFDPTPGRGELGGSYSTASPSADRAGIVKAVDAGVAGVAGAVIRGEHNTDPVRPRGGERAAGRGTGAGRAVGALLLALPAGAVLVGGAKAARGAFRTRRRDPRRAAAGCRAELVALLVDQGAQVRAGATLLELELLARRRLGVDARPVTECIGRARYGRSARAADAAAAARTELRALRSALRRRLSLSRRLRGAVSLRSLRPGMHGG